MCVRVRVRMLVCVAAEAHLTPRSAVLENNRKVRSSNLMLNATYDIFDDALQFRAPEYPTGSAIKLDVSFDGGMRYIAAPGFFKFEQGPEVSAFNPSVSPLRGDTVITIIGSRFWDNAALSCKFEDAGETRALWVSTTMIKCASAPYFSRPVRSSSDRDNDVIICVDYNSVSSFSLAVFLARALSLFLSLSLFWPSLVLAFPS